MKTRSESEMGYLSQRGKIGQYKGKDVYVYELSEIEPWMKHTNEMFLAILEHDRRKAVLVLDGIIVGELDDGGSVNLYENGKRKAYVWPEDEPVIKRKLPEFEVKKNIPAPAPVPVEVKLEKLVLDVSEGYSQYSKVVDKFFEGLEKLWQEIDVEIQGQGNL